VRRQGLLCAESVERRVTGQHLVPHYTDRVDIHPAVEMRVGDSLLGGHVRRGPERDAGGG
jgi:hypothetical protein